MNKRNITKFGTAVLKVLAVILAFSQLPELQEALGVKASWAAIAFTGASAAKDIIVTVMDAVDDGKINGSVVPKSFTPLLLLGFVCLALPSCVCATDPVSGDIHCTTDPAIVEHVTGALIDKALENNNLPPRPVVIPEK